MRKHSHHYSRSSSRTISRIDSGRATGRCTNRRGLLARDRGRGESRQAGAGVVRHRRGACREANRAPARSAWRGAPPSRSGWARHGETRWCGSRECWTQARIREYGDTRRDCVGQTPIVGSSDTVHDHSNVVLASERIDHSAMVGRVAFPVRRLVPGMS
jgi:hypothetical protein